MDCYEKDTVKFSIGTPSNGLLEGIPIQYRDSQSWTAIRTPIQYRDSQARTQPFQKGGYIHALCDVSQVDRYA